MIPIRFVVFPEIGLNPILLTETPGLRRIVSSD